MSWASSARETVVLGAYTVGALLLAGQAAVPLRRGRRVEARGGDPAPGRPAAGSWGAGAVCGAAQTGENRRCSSASAIDHSRLITPRRQARSGLSREQERSELRTGGRAD